jgi:hypothetical protein
MDAMRLNKAGADFAADFNGNLAAARWFFYLLVVLASASLPKLFARGLESGHTIGSYSWLWVILLSAAVSLALAELVLLILLSTGSSQALARFAGAFSRRLAKLGWLNGIGMGALWSGYVLVVLWRYQKHFEDFAPQAWLFWLVAGMGALLLVSWKEVPYSKALLLVTIFYAAGVKALGYLPEISNYPFSLSWSEASRYYYASLPYSNGLYGFQIPLSFLHPTRYLLQSIAFWVPGAGIGFHRFWQVLLWLSLSLLTGLVLARRFPLRSRGTVLAVALWATLFTLQGPVYYHLLVCVILVLFGFDQKRFWRTLFFIVLASAWAGISRVNWIPVPAMLAAALYLIEKPFCAAKMAGRSWAVNGLRYLWPPLAWGVAGGLAALAAQAGYMLVSGHEGAGSFGSSFSSALLWYRLFSSPTFPLGVLPAILLVSAPLLVLIGGNWLRGRADWHPLRVLGLSGMGLVLFAGGLVVSAKIGGGSNIHNMDAFLVLLLVVGASIGLNGYASETGARASAWHPWLLLLALVVVPVIWNLNIGDPFVQRNFEQANYDLDKLNKIVQQRASQGEILFITQRQLEIFKQVSGVRLVPDYELMTLMEMAISGNRQYLDHFQQDLKNHRFALIVADRQHLDNLDPEVYSFAEENNAWVVNVSNPLLLYYRQELYFDTQGIQLLVPRE